jgi:hypothetical protein
VIALILTGRVSRIACVNAVRPQGIELWSVLCSNCGFLRLAPAIL